MAVSAATPEKNAATIEKIAIILAGSSQLKKMFDRPSKEMVYGNDARFESHSAAPLAPAGGVISLSFIAWRRKELGSNPFPKTPGGRKFRAECNSVFDLQRRT
jgi:hypothetical protein